MTIKNFTKYYKVKNKTNIFSRFGLKISIIFSFIDNNNYEYVNQNFLKIYLKTFKIITIR